MCSVNNYFRGQKPHPRHKRCMDWSWTTHIVVFCQLNAHNALRAGGPFGIVPLQPVSQSNYSWCLWTCPVTDAGAVSYWCCGRPVRFHWNHPSPLSASVRIRLDPPPLLSADVLYGWPFILPNCCTLLLLLQFCVMCNASFSPSDSSHSHSFSNASLAESFFAQTCFTWWDSLVNAWFFKLA